MLSTYTAEQSESFPEGEAAVYYRNPRETDEILARLEADPTLVARIREKGQAIARKNTYNGRVSQTLEAIGS